jgi:hypothetical protein
LNREEHDEVPLRIGRSVKASPFGKGGLRGILGIKFSFSKGSVVVDCMA